MTFSRRGASAPRVWYNEEITFAPEKAMPRHFTPAALKELVAGPPNESEIARAVQHVASCRKCWSAAADYLAEIRCGGKSKARAADSQRILLSLIEEGASYGVETLKARAWWAAIRDLALAAQVRKIRSVSALQSLAVFDVLLGEAWTAGLVDPFRGQAMSQLALVLAHHLPAPKFSDRLKSDLRGEALTLLANFRRLAADWRGATAAIQEAWRHLSHGTGDAGLEARLLSIHASLCSDTGKLENSLELARRAGDIYKDLEDYQGFAHTTIQEANYLVAAHFPKESIERVNAALAYIPPHNLRLQVLARFILVESLVMLGRPMEALRIFQEAQPMCEQADLGTKLRSIYFEALLLDGLGCIRESEMLFGDAVRVYLDHELYKEAFITLLTLFESFCRRGALRKAEALCEAAIEATSVAGEACNDQICRAWEELRDTIRSRQLTESELAQARRFLVRTWSAPDRGGAIFSEQDGDSVAVMAQFHEPPPPTPAVSINLVGVNYQTARVDFDRQLIEGALEETGGNISEASRILGIARNTLRAKIRRYGL